MTEVNSDMKQNMKYGIIILIILFINMMVVLLGSADNSEPFIKETQINEFNNSLAADKSTLSAEENVWELPQLEFKKSPEYVIIDGELSTMNGDNLFTIPIGSIVHHSPDGITTVFTSEGKYYLSAIDSEAKKSITPGGGGFRSGTHVIQVPSGSDITTHGNVTKIRFNGTIIMTIVDGTE